MYGSGILSCQELGRPRGEAVIAISARGVLLDIEGTTSSIRFVYEEMFPFVRRELAGFLAAHRDEPSVQQACQAICPSPSPASGSEQDVRIEQVIAEVTRLMDEDAKTTGLKQLQGLIWKSGFEGGELQAHLFDDVTPALRQWRHGGVGLRIYSSGSIGAQKLFFGHTIEGDLLTLFDGHYDTTIGSKREAASYHAITEDWGLPAKDILFLSDVPSELDAARTTGMQTALCQRPGNATVPPEVDHPRISSFADLSIAPP